MNIRYPIYEGVYRILTLLQTFNDYKSIALNKRVNVVSLL